MKVSDYITEFLEKRNVKHIFILPGGGAVHINDSIGKSKVLRYICVLHEQAAAIAADSYARMTDDIGVVNVTSGPGSTNAVTGVAGAWLDSIPCMIISGQVTASDLVKEHGIRQNGWQEIGIQKIVESITKYSVVVDEASKIRYHLEKGHYLAKSGRPGPVWIAVPLDIQAAKIEPDRLEGFDPAKEGYGKDKVNPDDVARALELLLSAKHPVVIAGNGIRLAHAVPEFVTLAERLRMPVLTSWGAIDFLPSDHPYLFGRLNVLDRGAANRIIRNSDVILAIGARLGIQQTGRNYAAFAKNAKLITVDVDGNELRKQVGMAALPIKADAGDFINEMNRRLEKENADPNRFAGWLEQCRACNTSYPDPLPGFQAEKDYANPYLFIEKLSKYAEPHDILVPSSSGTAYIVASQAFRIKKGQRFLTSRGLASMGWDIPSAIGACLGGGMRRTICITGDGSFQMNIQELQTIKNYGLPIKLFVLNDGGYATMRDIQRNHFNSNYVACNKESGLILPDLKEIAQAYHFDYQAIRKNDEIESGIMATFRAKGPAICEVLVSS